MLRIFKNIYFTPRLYGGLGLAVTVFLLGYFMPSLQGIARLFSLALGALAIIELLVLFVSKKGIQANRFVPDRFSNGDEHTVRLYLENRYPFKVRMKVVDEIPVQFQIRDAVLTVPCKVGEHKTLSYTLRPVTRGVYQFGWLNVFVTGFIGLVSRRYQCAQMQEVACYPGFLKLKKYDLKAISQNLKEIGLKKIRRIGHSMEFEQIKEYVAGDDFRTINWKASAKRGDWMVNHYQEERSQQVYSIIDMGRSMKMPFKGMSLLDYAINASLVLSNVIMLKHDKAGLATYSHQFGKFLPASRRSGYMQQILEHLYHLDTQYQESNLEQLVVRSRRLISQRSLLVLYTNFETLSAMRRQLPYLRKLASQHLLLVVFFENTELNNLLEEPANSLREIYVKTTAENISLEKRQIVKELQTYGIHALLTAPEHLTLNAINKYLEFKSRGMI